jgi:hypothetical protein
MSEFALVLCEVLCCKTKQVLLSLIGIIILENKIKLNQSFNWVNDSS